ncbi:protein of unknown function [Streptomyces sp. KY75]|nr:protein of unknown function [Streptomyces sp. KY70]CAD5976829.1 protein of unknown function [Streptomyces sp. KY75]
MPRRGRRGARRGVRGRGAGWGGEFLVHPTTVLGTASERGVRAPQDPPARTADAPGRRDGGRRWSLSGAGEG